MLCLTVSAAAQMRDEAAPARNIKAAVSAIMFFFIVLKFLLR